MAVRSESSPKFGVGLDLFMYKGDGVDIIINIFLIEELGLLKIIKQLSNELSLLKLVTC